MSENQANLVLALSAVCKIDIALAGILAERKRLEKSAGDYQADLKRITLEFEQKKRALAEKKLKYQREEAELKAESEKLVSRRKALGTLGNKKSLEKAEQEITFASRQLEAREEALLSTIDANEALEKELQALQEKIVVAKEDLKKIQDESREAFVNFESRESQYREKREELIAAVSGEVLSLYDRIREKFVDAVVPVSGSSCSSCFISVAPQLLVEIQRGEKVVRCRGCGRILFIDQSTQSA